MSIFSVSTTQRRGKVKPVTPADKKLSIKHLKDSVKYNVNHANEHISAAKDDVKTLRARGANSSVEKALLKMRK